MNEIEFNTKTHALVNKQAIAFGDIFDLAEIQRMQDLFADAHSVASLITDLEGNPITKPSNFTHFCENVIRKTEIGCANCFKSDAVLGSYNPKGATVQKCLSGGLWDAGASITVGGKHIANWLIGQVRNNDVDLDKLMHYASEIGVDIETYKSALENVPIMSVEQFTKIANLLFVFANELSERAFANLELKNKISESEHAHRLLKESEERFQLLFNKAPLGYQSLDINGCFIEVNQQWLDTLGYDREEVVGRWFGDFMPPKYQELVKINFPKFLEQGHIHSEFEMLHKDGRTLFIAFDGKIGHDTEGNFKQTHCILQDITQSKRTQDALIKSEQKHRTILQTAMDGFWLVDLQGNLLEVNEAYCNMSGYSEAELLKMNICDVDVVENEELTREHIGKVKTFGHDRFETKHRCKDGNVIDIEITVKLLGNDLLVVFLRDITLQITAKQALLDAEWKFKALFELGPIGVAYHRMIYDDAGKPYDYYFIDANASYNELTGVSPKGMTVRQAFPGIENDPADWIGKFGHVAKTGETFRIEQFFVSNSRWYDCVAYQYKPDCFVAAFTEITQRKVAENALKESENRFKVLFDDAPDAMLLADPITKKIIDANNAACILFGRTKTALLNLYQYELHPPQDIDYSKQSFNQQFNALESNDTNQAVEHKIICSNGEIKPVEILGQPIIIANKALMLGTFRDITQRKLSEEKLKERESKYRLLAENTTDVIWVLNITNNQYTYISPSIFQLRGITVEEAMVEALEDSLTGESLVIIKDLVNADVARFLEDPNLPIDNTVEVQQPCKDGTIIWVEISTRLKYNEQNEIEVIGVSRNITERKINEHALRESEERFRATFEQAAVGISQIGLNGRWLRMNQRLCDIVGYERDELSLLTFQDITHKDDLPRDIDNLEQLLAGKIANYSIEKRYITKNGSQVWVNLTVGLVRDAINAPKYFVSVVEDITERKNAEFLFENQRELYLDLVNTQPAGIYRIRVFPKESWENDAWRKSDNPPYKMELISDRFCEILEITPELFERHPGIVIDLLHPDDKEAFVRINDEANTTVSTFSMDCRLLINNKVKWVHFESLPRKLENGDILYTGIIYDITEQKIAHEKLQDSEMRFRNILQDVDSLAVQGYALDGTVQYWNKASELMYGYTAEEALGKNFVDLIVAPDLRESALQNYLQLSEISESIPASEYSFMRKDGSFISVLSNHAIVQIVGQPKELFCIDVDLTDRKKAEQALRKSEEMMRTSQSVAHICSYSTIVNLNELDKSVWECSPEFYKIFGIDETYPHTIAGWAALIHPDHSEDMIAYHENVIKNAVPFSNEYKIIRRNDGAERWVQGIGELEYDVNAKPIRMYGAIQDITERKNAEYALRESERKLSALFNAMTEIVVMHELVFNDNGEAINYRFLDCNHTFTKITGIDKENVVGRLATEVYRTNEAPYLEDYAQVAINGTNYEFSTYYAPLDKHFLISVVSTQKNRFSTIATDITSTVEVHNIIKEKNKELENYIYVASHDLRSPLVNIQGFSQRLQKQTQQLSQFLSQIEKQEQLSAELSKITTEDIPKSLNFILNNVSKMDTLINGLLQVSRTGRVAINPAALNMNDLFKTILRVFDYQLNERKAKLIVHELDSCFGDANQLNQLFSNIISNAIKYSDKNRALVIEIASEVKYSKVLYSIKDNGIGIAEKQMSKIWDIFYRANSSSDELGEGLGLSIAKQITEKHRGKIWAESVEGDGTTFFVELYRENFMGSKE
jgi:PAS domain S-box-containing protein